MKKLAVMASASLFTIVFSHNVRASDYFELTEQMRSIVDLLKNDDTSLQACTIFAEFQKERDALLSANTLSRFAKHSLTTTKRKEDTLKNFCENLSSGKSLSPSRDEALQQAHWLLDIFGWE